MLNKILLIGLLLTLTACNVPNRDIQKAIKICENKQGLYELHLDVTIIIARCGDNTSNPIEN